MTIKSKMNCKIKKAPSCSSSSSSSSSNRAGISVQNPQHTHMIRCTTFALLLLASLSQAFAAISSNDAAFFLDFATSANGVRLVDGARHDTNSHALLLTTATQYAEIVQAKSLDGI